MTATALTSPVHRVAVDQKGALSIMPVFLIALVAVFVVSLPNLMDPMIAHDDYPALFADADMYWNKTLHEGRWINFVWHLRAVMTPAWLNFALYQLCWAALAAGLAVASTGASKPNQFNAALALMVLVAPPATQISIWFNTLLPGLALLALFAVIACRLPQHICRLLLPVFVVATFMAYPTYPLILLALCLVRTQHRRFGDLVALLTFFVLSYVTALVVTYALNWHFHGIFGVPLDDWRHATPAQDLAGLQANLPLLLSTVSGFVYRAGLNIPPAVWFHLALLAAATLILLRRAPMEALYLLAGLLTGLGFVAAQSLKLGVIVPPRAFMFAWVFYAIIVVRAAQMLTARRPGRIFSSALVLIIGIYLYQIFGQYSEYRPWQAETRRVADAVENAPGPVFVMGEPMHTPAATRAGIFSNSALTFRLRQLAGRAVIDCTTAPQQCAHITPAGDETGSVRVAPLPDAGGTIILYPSR